MPPNKVLVYSQLLLGECITLWGERERGSVVGAGIVSRSGPHTRFVSNPLWFVLSMTGATIFNIVPIGFRTVYRTAEPIGAAANIRMRALENTQPAVHHNNYSCTMM